MMASNDNSLLQANLTVLQQQHPVLAGHVANLPERTAVCCFKARDGSVGYGLRRNGKIHPLTDPVNPTARLQQQLDALAAPLADRTRPVLIIGLHPGTELLGIFNLAEQETTPHCPQPIWVCLDSLECFYGFLSAWDARQVLQSPRVSWFRKDQMPERVQYLRDHPEFPHIFTLISGAPDQVLNRLMPPLAQLVEERQQETERLISENNEYYDALSDEQLAGIISGAANSRSSRDAQTPASGSHASSGSAPIAQPVTDAATHENTSRPSAAPRRPPRLMTPTCNWSTYVQHSARDTCAAFAEMGWETSLLSMEAMLTPYYLARRINEFKPDVFLFIDHLRSEAEKIYPRNMMFITWVQDEMDNLFCAAAGEKLSEYAARGRRDLVVGYVDRLAKECSYPPDRLVPLHIPANPAIFHPVTLSSADKKGFACDLAFMSNVSLPSGKVVDHQIMPVAGQYGLTREIVMPIHDELWRIYRSGKILADRNEFHNWLLEFPEFAAAFKAMDAAPLTDQEPMDKHQGPGTKHQQTTGTAFSPRQDSLLRLFYWRLNDTIARHVVLEWADELGLNLHLYGQGWENHPRFSKYAKGALNHGPELNIAYQAARFNLHLNISTGMHQRIWEILSAGARPLLRRQPAISDNAPSPASMRQLAQVLLHESTSGLTKALEAALTGNDDNGRLADWVFNMALATARTIDQDTDHANPAESEMADTLSSKVMAKIETALLNRPEWIIPDWEQSSFSDRQSFTDLFAG